MFYISSEVKKGEQYGITDTVDGVEEFYTVREIYEMQKSKVVYIYGVTLYNGKAECSVLSLGIVPSMEKFKSFLDVWRERHNQWVGMTVENYFAVMSVGTRLSIVYQESPDSTRYEVVLEKKSWDAWFCRDKTESLAYANVTGDTRFALQVVERLALSCYCRGLRFL